MKTHISILLLALCLSTAALAELTTMIRAVELSTSNMKVPTSPNGRLTFKPCSGTCDARFQSSRLVAETRFIVNDEATDFLGFRKAFYNLARNAEHYALVSYDPDSNTVTSVQITD